MIITLGVLLNAFAYAQGQPGGFPEGIGLPEQAGIFGQSAFGDGENQAPTIISFLPDKPSPQAQGTSIIWTVRAVDPENDPLTYMFQIKDPAIIDPTKDPWVPLTRWIELEENTWTWNTATVAPGNHQIKVLVRDPLHTADDFKPNEKIVEYVITAPQAPTDVSVPAVTSEPGQPPVTEPQVVEVPQQAAPANQPPVVVSLNADQPSPQLAGAAITFTASASDPENDQVQYMFLLDGQPRTDFTENPSWTWPTSANEIGPHTIEVRARDNNHNPEGDSSQAVQFAIEAPPNNPPAVANLATDLASPQVVGSVITFTAAASDPENDPLQYMFLLDGQPRTDFTENPSWIWTTTEQEIGTHTIEVRARDNNHNPEGDSSQAAQFAIEAPPNNPPAVTNLAADLASPQVVGSVITFTAAASDPENDPLQYMFLLDGQPVNDFTENPSWTWTTSEQNIGSHTVEVRARDNNHNPEGDSSQAVQFAIETRPNNAPEVSDLAADQPSPQFAGASITFTASASDPENDQVQYMFLLDGQPVTDFTENPSWIWTTTEQDIGSHTIEVRARDNNHNPEGDSSQAVQFAIEAPPNNPPAVTNLAADLASPQVVGSVITFTAAASDPENDPLQYMFLLNGQPVTDFTENPSWTWTATEEEIGTHTIEVRARDNNHNPEGDSSQAVEFAIEAVPNNVPVVSNLAADQPSPQVAGTAVTFTASATDPENDPLQYMFLLDGQTVTDFTENPSWAWTTTEQDIGSHTIEVRARDNNHNQEGDSSQAVEFAIEAVPNNPPEITDITADQSSPQVAGTAVTFTASATDPENDPLQYMFILDGTAQTEFTDSPSWTWTTSEQNIGSHTIEVRARDNNHNPEGDSSRTVEFTIEAVPNNPPEVVDFSADLASPQIAGAAITFTASATDPESDLLQYMFLLDGQPVNDFTENPSWAWTTTEQDIGSHTVEVRARDNNHNPEGDSSRTVEFTIETVPNNPPAITNLAADLASPQVAGTAVTFTASATDPENDPLQYMFLLDGQPVTDFTENPSWAWTTTEQNIGSHTVEVRARDNNHNPEGDSSQAVEFAIEAVPNNVPVVSNLAADQPSPQVAGTAVIFTASATDPENDPLQYMFLLDGEARTEFTDSPSWTWETSEQNIGPHTIEVRARDNNHNPEGDSSQAVEFAIEAVPNNVPVVSNLTPDQPSPQVAGKAVTFTASATDPENDPLQYMFLLDGQPVTDFTENPSWAWTTTEQDIGSHTVEARARDNNHNPEGDNSNTTEFVIEAVPNNYPEVTGLSSDLTSPQIPGSTVVWTAEATDPESDPLSYRFLVNETPVTDWQPENQFAWTPAESGTSTIAVEVRDSQHDEPQADSGVRSAEFSIAAPEPAAEEQVDEEVIPAAITINESPGITNLVSDLASPQIPGSTVVWTAEATDPENDPLSYRFLVNETPVTDWQPENQFAWTPGEPGASLITAQVRDSQHEEPQGEGGNRTAEFIIALPPEEAPAEEVIPVAINESPGITSLVADLASPQLLGSTVVWTAEATDPENDPLSYRFLVNETPATDWQPENQFAWTPTESGTYLIAVQTRDNQHEEPLGEGGNRTAEFIISLPPEEGEEPAAEEPAAEEPAAEEQVDEEVIPVAINESPGIISLVSDLTSPQLLGTTVVWTVTASDPENDTISYRFLVNETPATDWQPENQFAWTSSLPGASLITAQVRDNQHEGALGEGGNRTAEFIMSLTLEEDAPFDEMPSEEVPSEAGANVTEETNVTAGENVTTEENITAEAENVTEEVEISNETLTPPITEDITTPVAPENITENVTGEEAAENETIDAAPTVENQTPVLNSLIPDIASPQRPGVTVVWTANATDVDMDPLLFRFLLNGPATNGDWEAQTEWDAANTWSWETSAADTGENQVRVQVRDGLHAGEDGFDSELSGYFTLAEPKLNIAGSVYTDSNGNGAMDSGEGLSGWTVQITKPDQSQVSVITREDGSYSFEGLDAGSYTISETLPSGWEAVSPESGSHTVELSDSDSTGIDFVNERVLYAISGRKYNDLDGNGVNDGEPGIEGWTVQLSQDGSIVGTATTEGDGSYRFAELSPGSYTVAEVEQSGWTRTAPAEGTYTVELTDSDVTGMDFGNHGSFVISGMSFLDSNSNGVRDADEAGQAGVSIQLSRDGTVINATATAEDGSYFFRNLAPGTYTVSQIAAEGISQVAPEGPWAVEIVNADVTGRDFANRGGLSISGQKYYDINANGAQDPDEPGIPGGAVSLVEDGNIVANTTTDDNGMYNFENVLPGTYTISDPVPPGLVLTTSSTITVTVKTVVVTNANFGLCGANVISGVKYEDLNGDGSRNSGERGIPGWEMVLTGTTWYGKPLPTLTAATDNNGNYRFDRLLPGTYRLSETSRTGWTQTAPSGGSYNIAFDFRAPPREERSRDFGNSLEAQSVSGVKYNDINANGARDPGEPGMAGWTINLEPAGGGVVQVATTEADGSYSFTNVASGTYTVREIQQPGWTQTAPAGGTYTVTLTGATPSVAGRDFGNSNPLPTNPTLVPDKSSPQRAGTPIVWTAGAQDLDPLQFRFFVKGPGVNLDTGYSSQNVWTWNTISYPAGNYQVEVWIRDGEHAGPGSYDARRTVSFSLTSANLPPRVQVLYTDRPAPQYAGSWIKWTAQASDPEGDPLQYRYFLRGPSTRGFWVDMTGWSNNNRWIWRTTPVDVGYSEVLVAVRDGKHASPGGSDDYQVGSFYIVNLNLPPVITSLGTNLPSAQPVGATIRWSAAASDPEGNPLFFRYWLRGPSTGGLWRVVRDWSTDPTWTWPTTAADAGTSEVQVQVRDGLHSSPGGWDDDAGGLFTILRENLPPTLISLGSDKPSSQKAGTPVTWMAVATDPDREPLLYRFWLKGPSTGNAWRIVQDWSYRNQWTWSSRPSDGGAYTVYVYVRDGRHNPATGYDSALGAPFILSPNQPPVLTALRSDKTSPQEAGTPVMWTAVAGDADRDPIYYRFWLKGPSTGNAWRIVQDWSLSNQWIWSSLPNDGGNYTVYVYARDGWHYPDTGYDSAIGSSFQLIFNQPPTLTSLRSDRPSPQGSGTTIRWTAAAIDRERDPLYYQFWLKGPSTDDVWRIVQAWSVRNQWTWSNAPTDYGNYKVYAYVRDGKHALANAYDSAVGQGYTLQP